MSSAVNKEKSKIFETILSSPGMSEKCKVMLLLSRQNVLLLSRLIEAGLLRKEQSFDDEILRTLPAGCLDEFKCIHEDIVRKSELTDSYNRLIAL